MQPIQEEIYNAVKEIADLRGYSLVLDRASDTAIIFGSPKIDISDEVLRMLGYSPRYSDTRRQAKNRIKTINK